MNERVRTYSSMQHDSESVFRWVLSLNRRRSTRTAPHRSPQGFFERQSAPTTRLNSEAAAWVNGNVGNAETCSAAPNPSTLVPSPFLVGVCVYDVLVCPEPEQGLVSLPGAWLSGTSQGRERFICSVRWTVDGVRCAAQRRHADPGGQIGQRRRYVPIAGRMGLPSWPNRDEKARLETCMHAVYYWWYY